MISGCVFSEKTNKDTVLGTNNLISESAIPYKQEKAGQYGAETDLAEENGDVLEEGSLAFTDDVKADLMRKQQELFYFSNLEITEQNLYVEILYALENYIDEMVVSTKDTNQIDKVFQWVLMDHPEIFYTEGYSFVKYTLGEEVQKIVFKGTYIYEQPEKEEKEKQIEAAVDELLLGIALDATDYEKVKYVYETIIHNTEYDMNAEDNQNICSVFLNHASVCQGYAKAMQYLLMKLKVPVTLVTGTVETGEGHAWNLVKVENEYYYVDSTWGDASYRVQNAGEDLFVSKAPAISYDYLCVTTEELTRTHALADIVPLPVCDSVEANYYVREGAYFTEADYEQLVQLINRYQTEGRESVTLRCAGEEVYQQMRKELLTEQKIFRYVEGMNNSIVYTDSPKQRSITFWF